MRPTARNLAMRDPALAAVMGLLPGSDFGHEDPYGVEFGDDDISAEFGLAAHPAAHLAHHPAHRPTEAHLMHAWHTHHARKAHSLKRQKLLNPNLGSDIQVEKYFMSMSQTLTIATPAAVLLQQNPDTTFRPQRMILNAPTVGFVIVDTVQVANVAVSVGGVADAFSFSAVGVGVALDMPTLSPANRAKLSGTYTGTAPVPFTEGDSFAFIATFIGPARVAGGCCND